MALPLVSRWRRTRVTSRLTITAPAAWPRAWAWALSSLGIGVVAHLAAGGGFAIDALLISAIALVGLSRIAAIREVRLLPLLGLLTLGQVVVHAMFSGTTHAHGATTSTSDSRMITAHLAAVVATALVLRRREATAWADARWSAFVSVVVRLLTRAAATARVPGLESRSPEFTRGWSVTSRCPNALPGRRGPPVVA